MLEKQENSRDFSSFPSCNVYLFIVNPSLARMLVLCRNRLIQIIQNPLALRPERCSTAASSPGCGDRHRKLFSRTFVRNRSLVDHPDRRPQREPGPNRPQSVQRARGKFVGNTSDTNPIHDVLFNPHVLSFYSSRVSDTGPVKTKPHILLMEESYHNSQERVQRTDNA